MDKKMIVLKIMMLCFLFAFLVYLNVKDNTADKSVQEIAEQLEKGEGVSSLIKGDVNSLKRYYSLNGNEYDGFALWVSENPMDVDEMLIVKAKSEEQAETLEESVESRIKVQKQNFDGYGAEQTALLGESIVDVKGNYVFFAVSENAPAWESIFLESIKR